MNLELLQTVDQSYPEHNDGILDSGSEALTCMFNRRGTLLAVGCNDGRVAIWDFMTRGLARICNAHIHPITSLSWNRSGCKLLSSSTDWNVILWDIASGDIDLKFLFPSPVLKSQFHPRNSGMFLVCLMKNVPVLVVRSNDKDYKHRPLPTDGEPELNIVASFDRRGDRIVSGSSKGKVLIIDTKTLTVLKSFKLAATAIKTIEFARRGSNFLVNSADRIIRVFDIEQILADKDKEVEALQRLQDLVNRTQWKKSTFSGDGEFIVAGSHRQHALYIWDKATGSLVKMLSGQKGETLLDIVWHPVRPIILSISNGVVTVWSQAQVELWSAYAPNFKELTENEDYEEKEDEFDIEDEDSTLKRDDDGYGGEDSFNVERVAPIPAFCSSDSDSEAPLDWLPMAPEIEDPEEPGWGQLEPSLNELPTLANSRKRRAEDSESADTESAAPKPKQPRTIEIEISRNDENGNTKTNQLEETKPASKKSKMATTLQTVEASATSTNPQTTNSQTTPTATPPSVASGNHQDTTLQPLNTDKKDEIITAISISSSDSGANAVLEEEEDLSTGEDTMEVGDHSQRESCASEKDMQGVSGSTRQAGLEAGQTAGHEAFKTGFETGDTVQAAVCKTGQAGIGAGLDLEADSTENATEPEFEMTRDPSEMAPS